MGIRGRRLDRAREYRLKYKQKIEAFLAEKEITLWR